MTLREPKSLSHAILILALLSALSGAMLHACWNAPLYRMDDRDHLQPAMVGSWSDAFRLRPEFSEPYIPVTLFSYKLDFALFGPEPLKSSAESSGLRPNTAAEPETSTAIEYPSAPGTRVMNALYHILAGFILWNFLLRLGSGAGVAALVALLWTGHPMALESVAWISERKNVLAALFGFAALLAWTAPRERLWRWPLVYLLYALAVLSKPSALGILPVLLGLELFDPRAEGSRRTLREWLAIPERLAIPVLISALGAWATVHSVQREILDPPGGNVVTALLTDVEIFERYIRNILLPINLSFFYAVDPIVSLADSRLWLHGVVLLAICGGCVVASGTRDRRLAAFGLFWFFGALGPNANLVGIPFWMQDRYAYLSAAGLLLAVIVAVRSLLQRNASPAAERNLRVLVPSCLCVALFAFLSAQRSPLFADVNRLVVDAAERQPGSAMARLCAAKLARERFFQHGFDNPKPDWTKAEISGRAAVDFYADIESCADVYAHIDRFSLRVQRAEMLMLLHRLDEAQAALGPVPPTDVKPLESEGAALRNRRDTYSGYTPQTLAMAYYVLGSIEASRAQTIATRAGQRAAAQSALNHANAALQIEPHNFEWRVFKARVLMVNAVVLLLESTQEKVEASGVASKACESEAHAILSALPKSSTMLKLARRQGVDLNRLPRASDWLDR
ncbi:MAG TPA: hypothetical protein VEK08_20415 [Planctomycetota bacterium]|nr:hypothetical protein [Planctomycetota bacterium]